MLITALMGSPRKQGSTARVVEEIIRGATERGAQTKTYFLNDMTIKGCQS
ncbi:MAG TPA: NAD(P)H-dependent oxidoreductase, partial [Bacillota bacterium]|nr:NAD(P)H-dependent oxidoreductase [Bacillota bacterium]